MTKNQKILIMVALLAIVAGAYFIFRKNGKDTPSIPGLGGIGGNNGEGPDNDEPNNNNTGSNKLPDPVKQAGWGHVSFPIDYYEKGLEVLYTQGLANQRGARLDLDGIYGPKTDEAFKKYIGEKPEYYYLSIHKITKDEYEDLIEPKINWINKYLIQRGKL